MVLGYAVGPEAVTSTVVESAWLAGGGVVVVKVAVEVGVVNVIAGGGRPSGVDPHPRGEARNGEADFPARYEVGDVGLDGGRYGNPSAL